MQQLLSVALSLALLASSTGIISTEKFDMKYNKDFDYTNNSRYTVSQEAELVSKSEANVTSEESNVSPYLSFDIGHGQGVWNSWFNWACAKTIVYPWAKPTYLYAKATVTADGEPTQEKTKSSTTDREISTDLIFQVVKKNRRLLTEHIVRGIYDGETKEREQEFTGDFSW